jgi:fatty-acid O-methyltransferase
MDFRAVPPTALNQPLSFRDRVLRHPIVWKLNQLPTQFVYRYVSRRLGADDVLFLNYGYEEDPPMALPLSASDEPNRFFIQLYHRTATQADLAGKRVLEVGCGHGGGSSYLMRTLHPDSYTGLDLNQAGIDFCRRRHNLAGMTFVQGNAENLPFPDQSFDVVINIESSLHYQDFPRFIREVERVLGPKGHFLYADLRSAHHIADWEAALRDAPLRMVSHTEISAEVVRGIEKNTQQWLDAIDRHVPAFLRSFARDNAGVRGSRIHQGLQNGGMSYRMYCFAKS